MLPQLHIHIWIFVWADIATVAGMFIRSVAGFLHVSKPGHYCGLVVSQKWTKWFVDSGNWCISSTVSRGNVSIIYHCFCLKFVLKLFLFPQCLPAARPGYVFKTHPFPNPKYSRCIRGQNNSPLLFHSYILGSGPSRLHPLLFTTWPMSLQACVCKQCCTCTCEYIHTHLLIHCFPLYCFC